MDIFPSVPRQNSGLKPWAPAPLSSLCNMLLSIHIIPGQEQRHLLFLPLGSSGLVWAVSSRSMFSGCRISGNLPGEALLESEKPVGHLWSVSGVGSKCLLSCECIYRASVLNRQGKGGGGERKSLFGWTCVSACKEWGDTAKEEPEADLCHLFSLLFMCIDQNGAWKQY